MSQDTRKDKRARDINVVVRYKSATVDEFIENHSFDISRGGAFIKTNNPFPPGTLLKFELRLAANEKVVSGVGRVVWKREQSHSTAENPAGMGVKFIKIDDASKTVIDTLVAQNPTAGGAFEAVAPMPSTPPPSAEKPASLPRPAPPAPPQRGSRTIAGMPTPVPEMGARAGLSPKPGKASDDASAENDLLAALEEGPRKTEPQRSTFASRRATMMGIGVGSSPPPAPTPEPPPQAPAATDAAGARPEPTVMKQAAELLAEALKEAGGSMDEIEGNPLFENIAKHGDGGAAPHANEERGTPPSLRIANEGGEEDLPTRVVASSNLGEAALVDPSGATEPMPKQPDNQQSGDTVAFQRSAKTGPPAGLPPLEDAPAKPVQVTPKAAPAGKKGGGGAFLAIGLLLLLGGGGFYAWKTGMFGGKPAISPNTPSVTIPAETAKAVPSATAPSLPTAEPSASAPMATTSASGAATAAPSAATTASAAAPGATAAVPATAGATAKPLVPVTPAPAAPPKTPMPKPSAEGDPAAPAPTAAAPKPTATAAAAPSAAPTAAPAPVPVAPPPDELK